MAWNEGEKNVHFDSVQITSLPCQYQAYVELKWVFSLPDII